MPLTSVGINSASSSSSSPSVSGSRSASFVGEVDLPARYSNVEHIGQGATCVVLKAHDTFLDRQIAVKLMRSELTDYRAVRRFQQEAKMMSSFNSKHLPVVLDFGLSPLGRPFMVMELVDGVSLKQTIVDHKKLSVELSIEITNQILSALQHSHKRGVVHRDLKAQNVMITWLEDGNPLVKLVDFGLAVEIDQQRNITTCGAALGTPYYMSPEQAQGFSADARSDLYSLGCVMFEMLTGHTPFEKNSSAETLSAHIGTVAPSLSSVARIEGRLRGSLERIVAKLLEKHPSNRFQSAAELRTVLIELIERGHKKHIAPESAANVERAETDANSFISWTSIMAIRPETSLIDPSKTSSSSSSSSKSSKVNTLARSMSFLSAPLAVQPNELSLQSVKSFSLMSSSKPLICWAMTLLAMALAVTGVAGIVISLSPDSSPQSASVAAVSKLQTLSQSEHEAKAMLSKNPSELVKMTAETTIEGKFHVAREGLWALPSLTDADLSRIKDFLLVRNVNLITAQEVTGEGFDQIKSLPIESLDLRSLTIRQSGFDAMGKMSM